MADKEVKVLITTEADVSQLEDFNSAMEEATKEVERLQDALDEAHFNGDDIEADRIADELAEAEAQAESLSDALNAIDSTGLEEAEFAAEELDNILSGIDGSGLDEAADSASTLSDELENSSESAGEMSGSLFESTDALTSLIGVAAAAGLADTFMGFANTAGNYADTVTRMGLEMQGMGVSADAANAQVSALSASTGRGATQIRNSFISMSSVGISSLDSMTALFEGASAQSFLLGVDVEQLANKYSMLAMRSSIAERTLRGTGITVQELGAALGMEGASLDEINQRWATLDINARAAALGQAAAMNEGKNANEAFKHSWEGLNVAFDKAFGKLQRLAGQVLLPVLIPALEMATNILTFLGNAFESLPAPVQFVIGILGTVAIGATTLALSLGGLIKIVGTLISPLLDLGVALGILETTESGLIPVQIAEGVAGNFSISWIWIAVAAILLLVGAFIYLYSTNEGFRNFINGLVEGFMQFCEMIWGAVTGAIQWLISLFTDFPGTIQSTFSGVFDWLQQAWANVVSFFQEYGQLFLEIFFVIATGGTGAIVLLLANIGGMPTKLGSIFQSAITKAGSFITSLASKFATGAMNAVNGFMNYIKQLPGKLWAELTNTLNRVISWGSQIVARFGEIAQRAWQAFLNGLGIHSPGYIQVATLKELDDTGRRIPTVAEKIVNNLDIMSTKAVNAWGDPEFDYGFQSTGNVVNNNIPVDSSGNASVNYIFNLYGDMDNEDRMEKFLEAVRREIAWNNETAGRTV